MPLPLGLALLGEGPDALAEVLGGEAGLAQGDQPGLLLLGQDRRGGEQVDRALVAPHRERRVGGDLGRQLDGGLLEPLGADDFVDEADLLGAGGLEVAAGEEELLGARQAHRVEELAQAGVAVDEAELDRRHPQLRAGGADPQVAGDRQLQPAADAVAVDRRDRRPGVGGDRLHRRVEGVGDERLGVALEGLGGDRGDVVAGREDRRRAGDQQAAGLDPAVEARHRLGEGVEDLVVEGVAALGVGDAEADDRLGGRVEDQLAAREPLFHRVPTPARRGRRLR